MVYENTIPNMEINGKTSITGIFGYPIEHTFSPVMHNAAFSDLRLNYCYIPFLVSPDHLKGAVGSIRALNMRGVNITIPHKQSVMPLLDTVKEEAAFIGAVNTVVNSNGKLVGDNTDGKGFMKSLEENGIAVDGKDVLIHGAGGASRAVSYYLCKKAKNVSIYGRSPEKAERLVDDLKIIYSNVSPARSISDTKGYDIIVNATPLGMKSDDPLPFDTSLFRSGQTVCDLIYTKTRFIEEAAEKGCTVLDGTGMLLWQGALSFELWTGKQPDISVMRNALQKARQRY